MSGSPSRNLISQIPGTEFSRIPETALTPPPWYLEHALWIEDAAMPGNAAHNYPLAMRIRGPLQRKVLARSVQEIMRRHPVLRSLFRMVDGKPAQLILPVQEIDVPLLDLADLPEEVRDARARAAVFEGARRPFDLTRGPMLRSLLVRLQPEDHILLLTTHHVVCDYWSTRILIRDLFALYAATCAGDSSPMTQPDFQYADYVKWLETRLQSDEPELMSFWRETLSGKDFHHLVPDQIPGARSYRGACEKAIFPEELMHSIRQLSVRERLSPFMTMLAALQCLVQRYSGHEEIGIGSCVANRPLPQLENLIGPFANVSILRTDLSGNPTGREVFRRTRETCLSTFNYQDVPFGTLVHKFQPRFDPARHPIFQILFVFLNAPSEPAKAPNLTVDPIAVDTETSCFEINMNVRMHERLEIDLQYSSDLFEAATIRGFLQDYRTVLETLCARPDVRIRELAITENRAITSAEERLEQSCTEYVAPRSAIESQLVELWEENLGKRPIGVNDNFFEIGGDSLRAARLFAGIQATFKRPVPLGTLFHAPTVATLAKVISDTGSAPRCVITLQQGGFRPPLFCVHGQSGSLLMYRELAHHLGSDQPVYGVQPAGFDRRSPRASIEEMASTYVGEVEHILGEGPYFLTGYCMGGTIAFEMAQQLRRRGRHVALVALLDTYNWANVPTSTPENLYFKMQTSWFGLRHFLALNADEKKKSVRRSYEELWNEESEISRHNRHAAMKYVPRVYPGRILHVRPTQQLDRHKRPELSLDSLAAEGVEEFWVRGYPGQILEEPMVREVAARLRACISEAARGPSNLSPAFPMAA